MMMIENSRKKRNSGDEKVKWKLQNCALKLLYKRLKY